MNKITLILSLLCLSGCTLFEPQEPLPLYALESGVFKHTGEFPFSVMIDEPLSEPSLNTARIALSPTLYQRDYLANASWPDRLPKLFQNALLQGLAQKWGEENVNRVNSGVQAEYVLSSDIKDFSVHHFPGKPPEISLQVTIKLIYLKDRKVIAAKTFHETSSISTFTMLEIVNTFNQSTHCLLDKIGEWAEISLKK